MPVQHCHVFDDGRMQRMPERDHHLLGELERSLHVRLRGHLPARHPRRHLRPRLGLRQRHRDGHVRPAGRARGDEPPRVDSDARPEHADVGVRRVNFEQRACDVVCGARGEEVEQQCGRDCGRRRGRGGRARADCADCVPLYQALQESQDGRY